MGLQHAAWSTRVCRLRRKASERASECLRAVVAHVVAAQGELFDHQVLLESFRHGGAAARSEVVVGEVEVRQHLCGQLLGAGIGLRVRVTVKVRVSRQGQLES